jgi:uncharacterized protein YceK
MPANTGIQVARVHSQRMKSLPDTDQRARVFNARLARVYLVVTLVAAIVLGGCASVRQSIGGWFAETPPSKTTAAATRQEQASAAGETLTYYAAVEGLSVYAEATESSKVVGHLALYEKVARSRLERGYAYVSGDKSGINGWVDNAKLVWRVPASTATEAADRASARQTTLLLGTVDKCEERASRASARAVSELVSFKTEETSARPEEPPSFGGVSKGAGLRKSTIS